MPRLISAHRLDWERIVRRVHPKPLPRCNPRIGHLSFEAKSLLFLIATYGDEGGGGIAVDDYRLCTITRRSVAVLHDWRSVPIELGLLCPEGPADAPWPYRHSVKYHLTVPVDFLEAFCMDDAYAAPVTPEMRAAVAVRDGGQCRYCRATTGPFQVDHVVPKSQGGLSDLENLVWACGQCNRKKHAKTWMPLPLAGAEPDHG